MVDFTLQPIAVCTIWTCGLLKIEFISKLKENLNESCRFSRDRKSEFIDITFSKDSYIKVEISTNGFGSKKALILNDQNFSRFCVHVKALARLIEDGKIFYKRPDGNYAIYNTDRDKWYEKMLMKTQFVYLRPAISNDLVAGILITVNSSENTVFLEQVEFLSLCDMLSKVNLSFYKMIAAMNFIYAKNIGIGAVSNLSKRTKTNTVEEKTTGTLLRKTNLEGFDDYEFGDID